MIDVDIQVLDKRFSNHVPKIKTYCKKIITHAWQDKNPAEISLVLANDDFVHQLNHQYRGKDCATNVLSFENAVHPPKGQIWLAGDIIIAYDTVLNESITQNKPFLAHFTHLLIHGALHLQGYDHLDDAQAELMESLEIDLLHQLQIPNPYTPESEPHDFQ